MKTKLLPLLGAALCAVSLSSCYVYDDPLTWGGSYPGSYYNSGYNGGGYYGRGYCPTPRVVVQRNCPPPVVYQSRPTPFFRSSSYGRPGYSGSGHHHGGSAPMIMTTPSSGHGGHHGGGSGSGGGFRSGGGGSSHGRGHGHGAMVPSSQPQMMPPAFQGGGGGSHSGHGGGAGFGGGGRPSVVTASAPAPMPHMPVSAPVMASAPSQPSPPPFAAVADRANHDMRAAHQGMRFGR